jgi:hypothetical protein
MRFPSLLAAAAAWLVLAGCEDSTGPAGEGTIELTVVTTGGDPDLDGYQLQLDDRIGISLAPSSTQRYVVRAGQHQLEFTGVAPNCTVAGGFTRAVTVATGETISVDLAVSCKTTGIQVSSTTSGIDFDATGYLVTVNGATKGTLAANGQTVISRLEPGEYTVGVAGLAENFTLDGPPTRTLSVTNATITPAVFGVVCGASFGVVKVEVSTTGPRPDDSYVIQASPDPALGQLVDEISVQGHDAVHFWPITGTHYVRLTGVAANCTVGGGNQRTLNVVLGGPARDTAVASFEVHCLAGNATIRFNMATTGSEAPASFTARLLRADCPDPYYCELEAHTIASNGVTSVPVLSDTYTLLLDIGNTCRWEPAFSQTVQVQVGATLDLDLEVLCERALLRITAPTSGSNPDPEYRVALWNHDLYYGSYRSELGTLVAGETLEARVYAMPVNYWVGLEAVAGNCTVGPENPTAPFTLDWGEVREVAFAVQCLAAEATIRFTTSTTGSEAPASFTALLQEADCPSCGAETHTIASNGVTSVQVIPDTYNLVLDVGATCRRDSEFYQSVQVQAGATLDIGLDVFCERALLRVTAPTTGSNPDTEYSVTVWTNDWYYGTYVVFTSTLSATATLEVRLVPYSYAHWVELGGVAANCTVGTANPTTPFTVDWGDVRDVTFPVTCGP